MLGSKGVCFKTLSSIAASQNDIEPDGHLCWQWLRENIGVHGRALLVS